MHYSYKVHEPHAYLNKWLPLAEKCLDTAIICAPMDSVILFYVAWYWVWRSTILPDEDAKQAGIRKFQKYFKRSLALKPEPWKKALDHVREFYADEGVMLGIVPHENSKLKSEMLKYIASKVLP